MELYSVFVTGANRGIGLEFVRQLVNLPKPPKFVFATYRSRDGIEKMEMHSAFVTGANRGIGLEFVRQLVNLPNPPKFVFATYRSKDGIEALKEIRDTHKGSQVLLIKMDVTKRNEIEAARNIVEDCVGVFGLTLLINNAAVLARQPFPNITEENLLYQFKANTIGPVMVTQEFLPLLQRAAAKNGPESKMSVSRAAVLNISSLGGSISHMSQLSNTLTDDSNLCPSYSISKAALNMMGRVIAAEVKKQGILVVLMCPGWVKTDMGTYQAQLEVNESVASMLNTLSKLDDSHHGEFMDRNGNRYEF